VRKSKLLGFRTLSIVRILNNEKKKDDVWETWSVSVLRWGKTLTLLGPLERANLNHWTPMSETLSYINTGEQAESMRANRKKCNKHFSKARTCVEPSNSVCYTPSSEPYRIYLSKTNLTNEISTTQLLMGSFSDQSGRITIIHHQSVEWTSECLIPRHLYLSRRGVKIKSQRYCEQNV
jgi:hypothetical protein